mmetsp:Transcript_12415/g.18627  ORF Transcript_12415/g.18627 Transcript_12415/m.18627 type:complete len:433 (+) Transcript_12415:38-1336(+)
MKIYLNFFLTSLFVNIVPSKPTNTTEDNEPALTNHLSEKTERKFRQISEINDFPNERVSEQDRVSRMIEVLINLPEDEKDKMNLSDILKLEETERNKLIDELWRKRQSELREIYENMPKPEEILKGLIFVLRNEKDDEKIVKALLELEDHLSETDMAHNFHVLGGFSQLTSLLSSKHSHVVREHAAYSLGTMLRNLVAFNHWAQKLEGAELDVTKDILSHNESIINKLLSILNENFFDESHLKLRLKAVYALGSILRHNIQAQEYLIEHDGMRLLKRACLRALKEETPHRLISKYVIKIVTLVSDLLYDERSEIFTSSHGKPNHNFRMISTQLVKTDGWCEILVKVWEYISETKIYGSSLELLMNATFRFAKECKRPEDIALIADLVRDVTEHIRIDEHDVENFQYHLFVRASRLVDLLQPAHFPKKEHVEL